MVQLQHHLRQWGYNTSLWLVCLDPQSFVGHIISSEHLWISLQPLLHKLCRGWDSGKSIIDTIKEIMSICRWQPVSELCTELVNMICVLCENREDVEKTAPSQLLQGVLQCRGLTEKYEARNADGSLSNNQLPKCVFSSCHLFYFFLSSLPPIFSL